MRLQSVTGQKILYLWVGNNFWSSFVIESSSNKPRIIVNKIGKCLGIAEQRKLLVSFQSSSKGG